MVEHRHDEADPVPHPLEIKLRPQICTVSGWLQQLTPLFFLFFKKNN
jgi:hypothetical protein